MPTSDLEYDSKDVGGTIPMAYLERDISKEVGSTTMVNISDQELLARMGHEQQLTRRFSRVSMLATCVCLMATWEALCSTMATAFISGGPVAMVYGYLVAFVGSICTGASFAEIASMYPTAGGQYVFVASLSNGRFSRQLSWAAGWISVFAWQSLAASAPFLAGTMIQGLLVLNDPTYVYKRWHGMLLYWAILLLAALVNVLGGRMLPMIENMTMALHVALFFALLIALLTSAPTYQPASFVFTEFVNNSGWSSDGIAWSIGLLSSCYVFVGYDGAVHLSEEMHDPARGIPFAIMGSLAINGILGFAFLMGILFCLGDLTAAVATSTGFPIIEVFYQATGSIRGATGMSSAIVLMAALSTIPLVS
ncbi:hypothetical protein LTR27_009685 [Elasticomyces elasticus]|nr:hypothetical protein LTR27_009685 [Elasticomyces elasticus]